MRKIITLAICVLLAACSPKPEHHAEYTLTYASPYPPTHPFSRADIAWMKHVEQASGGRIAFKPFWSGALISSSMSISEIRHGLADIGLITPIYTRGGVHLQRTQAGFTAASTPWSNRSPSMTASPPASRNTIRSFPACMCWRCRRAISRASSPATKPSTRWRI
jgi:TRAP-type mannitol/chloroaromatic compound transport system substrate-binding protein